MILWFESKTKYKGKYLWEKKKFNTNKNQGQNINNLQNIESVTVRAKRWLLEASYLLCQALTFAGS